MKVLENAELAERIVEEARFSAGGAIAVVAMVFVVLLTIIGIGEQDNVIREASAALIGLVLIVPLAAGAAIGRKRTYSVWKASGLPR
jgi:hypothetical protein